MNYSNYFNVDTSELPEKHNIELLWEIYNRLFGKRKEVIKEADDLNTIVKITIDLMSKVDTSDDNPYLDDSNKYTEYKHRLTFPKLINGLISLCLEFGQLENYDTLCYKFSDFIDNEDTEIIKKTKEFLEKIKKEFSTYPIIENKLVKIVINSFNFNKGTMNVDIDIKNENGSTKKKISGDIKYENIYNYINTYHLFTERYKTKK